MKRLLSLFMSVAVALGCMIFSITAETANTAAYAAGDGSEATPFEIATADQLVYFAQQINAGIGNDQYYRLTADIDLGGTYGTQTVDGIEYFIATNSKTWTAAGTTDHPFKGNFDGCNHKIENLVTAGGAYVGLFGVIEGATVQNVTIASGLVTTAGQEATSNPVASYAGAIAAYVNASENNTVKNCSISEAEPMKYENPIVVFINSDAQDFIATSGDSYSCDIDDVGINIWSIDG